MNKFSENEIREAWSDLAYGHVASADDLIARLSCPKVDFADGEVYYNGYTYVRHVDGGRANPESRKLTTTEAGAVELIEELARLRAENARQVESLAETMIILSLSTGHGDTFDDLLAELRWQVEDLRARLDETLKQIQQNDL